MNKFIFSTIYDLLFNDDVEALIKLLDDGCPVDLRDPKNNNQTLLMVAVKHSYFEDQKCIQLLLDRGADLEATCDRGMTPLMYAAYHIQGDSSHLRLLLDRGAKIERMAQDEDENVLSISLSRASSNITEALLSYDFDASFFETSGSSPFSFLCFNGDYETVRLLLEKGARVNGQGFPFLVHETQPEQLPPLWASAVYRNEERVNNVLRVLIEYGVDPFLKDQNGRVFSQFLKEEKRDVPPFWSAYEQQYELGQDVSMTSKTAKNRLRL